MCAAFASFWTRIVSGELLTRQLKECNGKKAAKLKLELVDWRGVGSSCWFVWASKVPYHQHMEALVDSSGVNSGVFRMYPKGGSKEFKEKF